MDIIKLIILYFAILITCYIVICIDRKLIDCTKCKKKKNNIVPIIIGTILFIIYNIINNNLYYNPDLNILDEPPDF